MGRKRSILPEGQQRFLVARPSESLLTVYVTVLCLSPLHPKGGMRLTHASYHSWLVRVRRNRDRLGPPRSPYFALL